MQGSLLGAIGDPSGRVSRIAHYPTTSGLLQGVKKTTHPHLQNAELHQLKVPLPTTLHLPLRPAAGERSTCVVCGALSCVCRVVCAPDRARKRPSSSRILRWG
jgi:hypothetical protein